MQKIVAGDLVCKQASGQEMLVIGRADEPDGSEAPSVFCVWEAAHFLHEEIVLISDLQLVRKERRRVPRCGALNFPSN